MGISLLSIVHCILVDRLRNRVEHILNESQYGFSSLWGCEKFILMLSGNGFDRVPTQNMFNNLSELMVVS